MKAKVLRNLDWDGRIHASKCLSHLDSQVGAGCGRGVKFIWNFPWNCLASLMTMVGSFLEWFKRKQGSSGNVCWGYSFESLIAIPDAFYGVFRPTLRCHSCGHMGWKITLIPSEAICWLATVLNSTGYISYKPFNCGVIQMHMYPAGTKCYFVQWVLESTCICRDWCQVAFLSPLLEGPSEEAITSKANKGLLGGLWGMVRPSVLFR